MITSLQISEVTAPLIRGAVLALLICVFTSGQASAQVHLCFSATGSVTEGGVSAASIAAKTAADCLTDYVFGVGESVSLSYKTTDGSAVAPGDYIAIPATSITLGGGNPSSINFNITTTPDMDDESNEGLTLDLSSIVPAIVTVVNTYANGTPGLTSAPITITDDDADLSLDKDITAYNADTGAITWRVRLTNNSGTTAATNVAVTDPELDTAGNAEYAAFAAVTSHGSWTGTVWTIPLLAAGATATATVSTTLQVERTVTNTAFLSASDQGDPDSAPGAPLGQDDEDSHTQNQYDYGDVPAAYGSSARHEIVAGGPVLGSAVDSDSGNQSHANALGDDGDADGDDDDSVTIPTYVGIGVPTPLTVAVSTAGGTINTWVDYDGDNVFETGEMEPAVVAAVGNNVVTITPPSGLVATTRIRFRLCSVATECDDPEESASDGEVEDYEIMIVGIDFGDAPSASYATLFAQNGARHEVTAPVTHRLGTLIDADDDAQHNATATGDDGDGSDDEDGVIFLTSLVTAGSASIASVDVTTLGAGFLSAWVDFNQAAGFEVAERVLNDVSTGVVGSQTTTFNITVPTGATAGTTKARFRFCSTAATCNSPTGFAMDGEVEDYEVEILTAGAAADAAVQLTSSTTATGPWTLQQTGAGAIQIVTTTPAAFTLFEVPALTSLNTLTVNGTTAADLLNVNYENGEVVPAAGLTFNGLGGGDEMEIDLFDFATAATRSITYNGGDPGTEPGDFLTIENTGPGGSAYSFLSVHTNEADGVVTVDNDLPLGPGAYDDVVITYTGLEPIFFTATAAKAEFHFNAGDNEITLNAGGDGDAANGLSFIDCTSMCGESVTFDTPSDSLIVRPGDGDDTITFPSLDVAAGAPTDVHIEGDDGSDLFIITPSAHYDPFILGEDPVLPRCYGDTIDLVTEGGVTDHSLIYTSIGNGHWDFTDGVLMDITFTSIETQLDARTDISVEVTTSVTELYPADPITVSYAITNTGFEHATCVDVEISIPPVNPTEPIVPSTGFFHAPDSLLIPWLPVGLTATLDIEGILDAHIHDTYLAALDGFVVSIDSIAANNADTVTVRSLPTFPFPAKAHGISALQINLPNGLERVLVGLAQGSPGLDTAVLCRIPDPDGVLFTQVGVGDRWRPCGEGLPRPVYINDMFLDSRGTPADSTDDRVWVATWGSDGLYYSDDFGVTFVSATATLPGQHPGWFNVYGIIEDASGILYLSANNGTVYRSFDRGDTWQEVKNLPGASADTPWSLAAHPSLPGVLYAGLFGRGVYMSPDYGFSWEPLGGEAVNNLLIRENAGHVFDLEFSPDSDDFLFAATGKGVWRMRLGSDGNIAGLWEEVDVRVTLDDGTAKTPEIRTLSFDPDADDPDDNLIVGSWGFGAFVHEDPLVATPGDFSEFALREGEVTLVLPLSNGRILIGTKDGQMEVFESTPKATSTSNEADFSQVPSEYGLAQNYPNPFNPATTIGFDLPKAGDVQLAVYDMLGREVALLVSGPLPAGSHQVQFDAAHLPSGPYLYRLQTDAGSFTRQLVLMK